VILITVDGLMPDSYLRPDELGLKVPSLRWLKQQGASSDGVMGVFPTLTYPSHTSMVTGVTPGKHRIVANRTFDPMETDMDGWHWYAEEVAAPPVWRIAEEHGIPTAIVYWPVTVGAAVHWRVPEFWRAANEQDLKLQRAVATPGLLETVAKQHSDFWTRFTPPAIQDDALVDITEYLLASEKPRLLLMHLVEVDTQQHRHGVGSPEARAAIEKDDAQVGRVLRTLERLNLQNETAVIVASDHGFRAAPNAIRPCTLLADAGLVTREHDKVVAWKATIHAHGGEAYVYLKDPKDADTLQRVRAVLEAKLRDPQSGIARLYEPAELQQLGGDATAAFALGAAPGYQFAAGCHGSYRVESNNYIATHGFDPRDADMRASLLMVGPSIPHGTLSGARLIDIGPTIAEWLALPMPGVEGKPLRVDVTPRH
jgi:predicted AlkP superfamily pyrophosphatase or phosphodiesterase